MRADVNKTKAEEEESLAQFARDCAVKARANGDAATAEWFDAVVKGHTKSARELREKADQLRNQAKVLPGKGNPNVKWKIDLDLSAGCFSPRLGLMVIAPIAAGEELLTAYDQSDNKKNARAEADATIALLRRHMKATEPSSPAAPPEDAAPPQDSDEEPEPTQLQPERFDEDTDIEMEDPRRTASRSRPRTQAHAARHGDWRGRGDPRAGGRHGRGDRRVRRPVRARRPARVQSRLAWARPPPAMPRPADNIAAQF